MTHLPGVLPFDDRFRTTTNHLQLVRCEVIRNQHFPLFTFDYFVTACRYVTNYTLRPDAVIELCIESLELRLTNFRVKKSTRTSTWTCTFTKNRNLLKECNEKVESAFYCNCYRRLVCSYKGTLIFVLNLGIPVVKKENNFTSDLNNQLEE